MVLTIWQHTMNSQVGAWLVHTRLARLNHGYRSLNWDNYRKTSFAKSACRLSFSAQWGTTFKIYLSFVNCGQGLKRTHRNTLLGSAQVFLWNSEMRKAKKDIAWVYMVALCKSQNGHKAQYCLSPSFLILTSPMSYREDFRKSPLDWRSDQSCSVDWL